MLCCTSFKKGWSALILGVSMTKASKWKFALVHRLGHPHVFHYRSLLLSLWGRKTQFPWHFLEFYQLTIFPENSQFSHLVDNLYQKVLNRVDNCNNIPNFLIWEVSWKSDGDHHHVLKFDFHLPAPIPTPAREKTFAVYYLGEVTKLPLQKALVKWNSNN